MRMFTHTHTHTKAHTHTHTKAHTHTHTKAHTHTHTHTKAPTLHVHTHTHTHTKAPTLHVHTHTHTHTLKLKLTLTLPYTPVHTGIPLRCDAGGPGCSWHVQGARHHGPAYQAKGYWGHQVRELTNYY